GSKATRRWSAKIDWRRSHSRRLSYSAAGHASQSGLQIKRWTDDSRPAVRETGTIREETRSHLRPRWTATANATRLALLRLLLERVRRESVSGQSGLGGAVGELPPWNRIRPRVPSPAQLRYAGSGRVSRCESRRRLSAITATGRSVANRNLWRLLWRLSHRDGAGEKFRPVRRRRRHSRCSRLDDGRPSSEAGWLRASGRLRSGDRNSVSLVASRVRERMEISSSTHP